MPLLTLTDDNFDETIQEGVTLVDFWAPWCGPCQMMGPVVDEIAKEFAGKAKVGKINVDESGATASQYGIMSIPAFKIFKDGVEVNEIIGGVGKEKLVAELNAALA